MNLTSKTDRIATNRRKKMKKNTKIVIAVIELAALGAFALLPGAQAVSPPPDGGYPGFNTAEGQNALFSLTTGSANTAVGWFSLFSNTDGSFNTALGAGTLLFNDGDENTALGAATLLFNSTGFNNTAVGTPALLNNTEGFTNTATGHDALFSNTTGNRNTATGGAALVSNTTGSDNTATGANALANNAGSDNTAIGSGAGINVSSANNVICLGANVAGADVSDSTWIGNVYGVTTQSVTTAPVIVSDTGQLGTIASSERFKKDIATMDKTRENVLLLRPVTFHYKSDAKQTPQFGLIAEEVAKINPALVLRDKQGKPYTVRYDAVNAMLLNEFLKEHKKVEEQQRKIDDQGATITDLKSTIARQQKETEVLAAQLKEQGAQIQKVRAHVELRSLAPQVVVSSP
jgi:Chaperone of endosialidase